MLELISKEVQHGAEVFGIALVNTALASAAMTALACCAMRLRGWNASSRYCAWWLVLTVLVVLPLAQIATWPPDHPSNRPLPVLSHGPGYANASQAISLPAALVPHPKPHPFSFKPTGGTLLIFYGCVIALQFLRLAAGLLASLHLKRSGAVAADPQLLAAFNRALALVNPRRPVHLAITASVTSPLMVGYLRPAILLPERLICQLNSEELEQVLSHELAHAARYDDWAIALQRLVRSLLFFHPLIQFVSWRIDVNREIACDDRVIASVRPSRYAACLTKIAELNGIGPRLAGTLPLLSRKSNLTARIELMLDRTRSHAPRFSAARIACTGLFGFAACVVGVRGPAVMAYPSNGSPQIAIPPTSVAATLLVDRNPQTEREAAPPVPPSNPLKPKPNPPSREISAIAVVAEDGSASTFDATGKAEHDASSALPPGTVVFRRDGHSYIIRDPSTIAGAEELLRPLDQFAHPQIDIERAQEQMSEAQKRLTEQMQRMIVPNLDLKALKQLDELNGEAAERLRSLDTKTLEKAGEEQRQKMQALIDRMQSQMAQQKLGEIQRRLGSMEMLRGNLLENQIEMNRGLQKKLKDLIERAEKQGLAKPLE